MWSRGSLKIQDANITQKSPSMHHRTTLSGYIVCDRNAMYDAGKEDYLGPSEHIGLDLICLRNSGMY